MRPRRVVYVEGAIVLIYASLNRSSSSFAEMPGPVGQASFCMSANAASNGTFQRRQMWIVIMASSTDSPAARQISMFVFVVAIILSVDNVSSLRILDLAGDVGAKNPRVVLVARWCYSSGSHRKSGPFCG